MCFLGCFKLFIFADDFYIMPEAWFYLVCKNFRQFQVAAIVLATVYRHQTDHHARGFLKSTINNYYTLKDQKNAVTLSWDLIMSQVLVDWRLIGAGSY